LFDEDAQVSITTIADEFALAVSHGLIRPHVQRVVNLRTGEVVGYQGLARWDHPERGLLEAEGFIDLVANTPMAPVVDLAVLRRTAAVSARAARRAGRHARSYGHLSRRLIGDAALEGYLSEIARDLGLATSDLYVEIAHPLLRRSSRVLAGALPALQDIGVKTVLTGVQGECDADEIAQNGFDQVRLARRFVHDATSDSARHRVLTATVALAHALDVSVIAVGVESEREGSAMLDAGVDDAQGFLLGAVVPAGTAE
jgi:EAL domain-containing protein (putative c-di-GMP-specific phosphodiesterase class I)